MKQTTTSATCHHCGTTCPDEAFGSDGFAFCCPGCLTIYQLFRDSGNESFYEGRSLNTELDTYSFLENYEIARRFINFSSEGVNQVSLSLPAVHCSSCVYVLENLPGVHEGVIRLSLDFGEKTASIYYDPQLISLRQLASLLDSIGYPPSFDRQDQGEKRNRARSLALKIGVAGFCFGNIMLLSFPSYLGMAEADLETFGSFFGYIMLVLSVPVITYAGIDYLRSAMRSVVAGHIHIDVPIALGIITLFARSAYEIITQSGHGYLDSLSGLVFFLLIGRWFQEKAYRHLSFERDYTSYFPLAILRKAGNGEWVSIPVQEVETGHTLLVRNNEILPADATLCSDQAMIDYSFVTGEDRLTPAKKGDFLYAGGRQAGPSIEVRVNKPCSQSYLTKLWNNPAFSRNRDDQGELMINRISRYFTWTILVIALLAGIFWSVADPARVWMVVSAVLIVACPCALALATPFTNGNTLRIFGRNHFFLRNTAAAEKLGHTDYIVLDKTGTLTSPRHAELTYEGQQLSGKQRELIAAAVKHSTHPVSRKIYDFLSTSNQLPASQFTEHPGKGIEAWIDDTRVRIGSAEWISGQCTEDSRVVVEFDGTSPGYFRLRNSLRPGLQQSLKKLAGHYPLIILSGDSPAEKEWLQSIFPEHTEMHFSMSPFEKLAFIQDLQASGKRVMMIGDGLNDAGALRQSDTGIAVTEDISQFSPASDGILEGNQLINLPAYMAFSKASHKIIKASFALSFLYNAAGLTLAVSGILTPVIAAILMPLSSVSVVAFTTFSGNYLAKQRQL